ncbi:MAG: response regulator transcription factor [Flavobacteriales bacterium]|nr:MAG: response regulator transcription factor [Flavobacteriales bacterium]
MEHTTTAPRPLRAIIVDDEEPARENLRILLSDEAPHVDVVATADSAPRAHEVITALDPDLVFLDIRMPSGTEGLDLLESMPGSRFMVVFVTAFKDHAVRAFHANAVDYVLKPIDPDELKAAVTKAGERAERLAHEPAQQLVYREQLDALVQELKMGERGPRIAVEHAKGIKLFDPRTIAHVEADGNCTLLHFADGTRYLDTRTLKVYEDLLDPSQFLRVHRSHLINMAHLREYLRDDGQWAVLRNGSRVPVARDRLDAFLSAVRQR